MLIVNKGMKFEEVLRNYFLKTGVYVARGVPFIYENEDVTDIDLWIYSRTSSFSREITIVDIKNKKSPQALERIFWINGLKQALDANKAIVATTDSRPSTKNFAKKQNVMILDGNFLSKLMRNHTETTARISDEEFMSLIDSYPFQRIDGNWKGRINACKARLAKPLGFDTCNYWLIEGKFFAQLALTREHEKSLALRCLYLISSYIALSIDFCMRELSFLDTSERIKKLKEGLYFGERGEGGTGDMVNFSTQIISNYLENGHAQSKVLKEKIYEEISKLPVNILAEYFSKTETTNNLFNFAKLLESMAMQRTPPALPESFELKGFLYCLLDYWQINRQEFSLVFEKK